MRLASIGVLLCSITAAVCGQGQIKADKSITLENRPLAVFVDDVTQIPIVSTTKDFTALDPVTLDPIWTVDRNNLAGFGQLASDDSGEAEDFNDIMKTPFVQLGPTIVDARNGASLFTEADDVRKIHFYQHLENKGLLLVRTNTNGNIKLFGFDDESGERQFDVVISDKVGLVGNRKNSMEPEFDENGLLRYADDKSLSLIDVKTGKLVWSVERSAAALHLSDDKKYVLVAEQAGGLLGTGYDKKIYAYDYQSGKPLWNGDKGLKLDNNFKFAQNLGNDELFIVNSDGFNVYNWKTGETKWKKDFRENAIRILEVEGDVIQVTYKNRLIPVSLKDGKSTMKKGEKIPGLSWFLGTLIDDDGQEVADGRTTPTPSIKLDGKRLTLLSDNKLRWGEEEIAFHRLAVDTKNDRFAVATVDLEKTKPKNGGYEYKVRLYANGKVYPVDIAFLRGIDNLYFNGNGDLLAYNSHLMYHFTVNPDGKLDLPTVLIMDYKKRGFEAIGKLLGGGDDEVPGYYLREYDLLSEIRSGRKTYDDIGRLPMSQLPILGNYGDGLDDSGIDTKKAKKFKVPMFLIFNAETGQFIHREDAPGDSANFTIDGAKKRIYFMTENDLRVYNF